jgi:hypothetical protein
VLLARGDVFGRKQEGTTVDSLNDEVSSHKTAVMQVDRDPGRTTRLERRQYWRATIAVSATVLLTAGILTLRLGPAVDALAAMVLLFDVYVIFEHLQISRIRRHVSDQEQERRFQARIKDPTKRWKLSPMDLESRRRWVEYSKAKDEMFAYTDIKQAPWYVVNADDKKCARLNCIHHLLSIIPYKDLTPAPIKLPKREKGDYVRPPITDQTFVPEVYRPA